MSYYSCQLSLLNHIEQPSDDDLKSWLHAIDGFELLRTAVHLNKDTTSISLLCYFKDSYELISDEVKQALSKHNITLTEQPEMNCLDTPQKQSDNIHACHHHGQCHEHSPEEAHHHGHSDAHDEDNPHEHIEQEISKDNSSHEHDHPHDNHWLKAGIGLFWGVSLFALSFFSAGLPLLLMLGVNVLTSGLTLYLGWNVYRSAWQALCEKRLTSATLYSISTLTIMLVSTLSLFIPGLPAMVEAAPLVLGFWHLGEGIEHSLIDKLSTGLDILECLPKQVSLKGAPNESVLSKLLIPNDTIIINSGQVLPVDGILNQDTWLHTTRIDGSPHLKHFKTGMAVKSGMRLASHVANLEMGVTKTYQNSYLALVAKNINQANQEKAPVAALADTLLQYFIPALLAVAVASGILVSIFFSPALAIECVVAILVSACPCVLSLITPMAVKIGMQKTAEHGVQFKNGKALQAAADIDGVVFDLNGTLTQGELSVEEFQVSEPKYLDYIALLESKSHHPVATVIESHIKNMSRDEVTPLSITDVNLSHHAGIKGNINGEMLIIGNKAMMAANGIHQFNSPFNNPQKGNVYIAFGNKVVGQVLVSDPLRADAKATIAQLQQLGKEVYICTGTDEQTALAYAQKLGIPANNICANTVGTICQEGEQSKQQYIQELQAQHHKVAMVGDAANDAAAIATANIGIAVKSDIGDPSVQAQAGMVIQEGELLPIVTAFDVAHLTKNNIYQNLGVSLTYNSCITFIGSGALIGLGLTLSPAIGVALMVIESSIVLANLYALKRKMITNTEPTEDVTDIKIQSAMDLLNGPPKKVEPSVTLHATIAGDKKCGCTHNHFFKKAAENTVPLCFLIGTPVDKTALMRELPESDNVSINCM